MEWITANWQTLVIAIVGIAKVLAKVTPSEVDDNKVGKAIKMLDMIGLVGNKTQVKITKKF